MPKVRSKLRKAHGIAVISLVLGGAATLTSCQPPDAVQTQNKTDIAVVVEFELEPENELDRSGYRIPLESLEASFLDEVELNSNECAKNVVITPAPGSVAKGVLWAPDSTWCNDSDRKVEKWVVEYKPGTTK
jgi:hypothetical protein